MNKQEHQTSAGYSKAGIVGENYGTVRKSENNGNLSNSGNVGGITQQKTETAKVRHYCLLTTMRIYP